MIKRVTDNSGKTHEIEIDDDMAFLAPYLMASKKLGIPIWRIRKLVGYRVPLNKREQQQAAILKDCNKKITITLLKKHQRFRVSKGKHEAYGYDEANKGFHFENTLNSLAHELSHLRFWQHDVDRFICETKLMVRFSGLSKRLGYIGYEG